MDSTPPARIARDEPRISPNRYASGPEAAILAAQIASDQADLTHAKQRATEALVRLAKTTGAVRAAEQALLEAREAEASAFHGYEWALRQATDLKSNIESCKALMHPIRKAPLEILSLIFEELSDQLHSEVSITDYRSAQKVPFVLSAVCRKWRSAAQATAGLWTRIVLELPLETTKEASPAWAAFLDTHRSYSGARLFDLFLIHGDTHTCSPLFEPIYRSLREVVFRTGKAHVVYNSADSCEHFQAFIKRTLAPKLKDATFETLLAQAITPHVFDFFPGATSLTSLRVVHCMPRWKPSSFPLLASVHATWASTRAHADLREMFASAPSLRTFDLKTVKVVDDAGFNGGLIAAPHLRNFEISVDLLSDVVAGSFRFPSLQSLKLHFPRYHELPTRNFPTARRLAMITAPCSTVRSLRIDATKADDRLAQALAQLKQLETFELYNCWMHSGFYTRLMQPLGDGSMVCPQLTLLALDGCHLHAGFDEEAPVSFVRSRWTEVPNGPKRVRLRVILHPGNLRPAFLDKLAEMQEVEGGQGSVTFI